MSIAWIDDRSLFRENAIHEPCKVITRVCTIAGMRRPKRTLVHTSIQGSGSHLTHTTLQNHTQNPHRGVKWVLRDAKE